MHNHTQLRAEYPLQVFKLDGSGLAFPYARVADTGNAFTRQYNPPYGVYVAESLCRGTSFRPVFLSLVENGVQVYAAVAPVAFKPLRMRFSTFSEYLSFNRRHTQTHTLRAVLTFLRQLPVRWSVETLEGAFDEFVRYVGAENDLTAWNGNRVTIFQALYAIGVLDFAREIRNDPTHPAKNIVLPRRDKQAYAQQTVKWRLV